MFVTKINLYGIKYSPPCQAVLMTAKELNIELNMKTIDLTEGQHLTDQYLKINPAHTIPAIDDNGFILTESRSIMRYLCSNYVPDTLLYPKCPKQRALIDQILDYDIDVFNLMKDVIAKPMFGFPPNEEKMIVLKDRLKSLNQMIGDKKYLVGDHLTIADLSVLATTYTLFKMGQDVSDYPNFKRWITGLMSELKYYQEICEIDMKEIMDFAKRMQTFFEKQMQQAN